jgi:hypothetical protein
MKRVRWKSRYTTGAPEVHARNRALVGLLEEFGAELGRKEHCQEMNGVYDELASLTRRHLDQDPAGLARDDAEGRTAVRVLLQTRFPLAALSTPACKECGLCDLLEGRIRGWLGGPPGAGEPPRRPS